MKEVAHCLENEGAEILLWNDADAFRPGEYTLPRLIDIARKEVGAAVLIFGDDDRVWYRGTERTQPRDNVLLEFGLLSAHLGVERTIIVHEGSAAMPTDLFGLGVVAARPRLDAEKRLSEWYRKINQSVALPASVNESADEKSSKPTDIIAPLGLIRLYRPPRLSSDRDMLADLSAARSATFVGVSHQRLDTYLSQVAGAVDHALPLEHIRVCYASADDGTLYEGADFAVNAPHSRRRIAETLMSPAIRGQLPKLKTVEFLQSARHRTFGGCFFTQGETNSEVYYVNHYLPGVQPGTEHLLTFRLAGDSDRDPVSREILAAYRDAFSVVIGQASKIGRFSPSHWDLSIQQWRAFVRACSAHRNSMRQLLQLLDGAKGDSILDIGAATGDTSRYLLDAGLHVTVLDSSPVMLQACRETLGKAAQYALCRAGDFECEDPFELNNEYDAIVCHLAIPSLAGDPPELSRLANWCTHRLKQSGRVAIACHNTAIETPSSDFDPRTDPLRTCLLEVARRHKLEGAYRQRAMTKFNKEDIELAFNKAGLATLHQSESRFPMSMRDRILMWSAPAVLDNIFDVEKLGSNIGPILEEAKKDLGTRPTPDMVVAFWVFQRGPTG